MPMFPFLKQPRKKVGGIVWVLLVNGSLCLILQHRMYPFFFVSCVVYHTFREPECICVVMCLLSGE